MPSNLLPLSDLDLSKHSGVKEWTMRPAKKAYNDSHTCVVLDKDGEKPYFSIRPTRAFLTRKEEAGKDDKYLLLLKVAAEEWSSNILAKNMAFLNALLHDMLASGMEDKDWRGNLKKRNIDQPGLWRTPWFEPSEEYPQDYAIKLSVKPKTTKMWSVAQALQPTNNRLIRSSAEEAYKDGIREALGTFRLDGVYVNSDKIGLKLTAVLLAYSNIDPIFNESPHFGYEEATEISPAQVTYDDEEARALEASQAAPPAKRLRVGA